MLSNYFDSVNNPQNNDFKGISLSLKINKKNTITKGIIGLISPILLTSCSYLADLQVNKPQQPVANLIPVPVEKTNLTLTVSVKGIVEQNKVVANVPENQIAKIHLGQEAVILKEPTSPAESPEGQPLTNSVQTPPPPEKPLSGQVKHISTEPTVEENQKSFAVEIALDKEVVDRLNNSENVMVDFPVSELKNILVVPTIALSKQNDATGVFVGTPNRPPKFVEVTTGASNGERTEVKTGLDGTEHILIEASQLPPGRRPPLGQQPSGRQPSFRGQTPPGQQPPFQEQTPPAPPRTNLPLSPVR